MIIAIASDHAGYPMKEFIKERLASDYELIDCGISSAVTADYPHFTIKAATLVAAREVERGIIICGSGIGSSIVANKVKGVRAALCHSTDFARLSREHNDANVLVLPGRFIADHYALEIVKLWLKTPFSGDERHIKRIIQIKEYEEKAER